MKTDPIVICWQHAGDYFIMFTILCLRSLYQMNMSFISEELPLNFTSVKSFLLHSLTGDFHHLHVFMYLFQQLRKAVF